MTATEVNQTAEAPTAAQAKKRKLNVLEFGRSVVAEEPEYLTTHKCGIHEKHYNWEKENECSDSFAGREVWTCYKCELLSRGLSAQAFTVMTWDTTVALGHNQ